MTEISTERVDRVPKWKTRTGRRLVNAEAALFAPNGLNAFRPLDAVGLESASRRRQAQAPRASFAEDPIEESVEWATVPRKGRWNGKVQFRERCRYGAEQFEKLHGNDAHKHERLERAARGSKIDDRVRQRDPGGGEREPAQSCGQGRHGLNESLNKGPAAIDYEEVERGEGLARPGEEHLEEAERVVDHCGQGERAKSEWYSLEIRRSFERHVEPQMAQLCSASGLRISGAATMRLAHAEVRFPAHLGRRAAGAA